MGLQRAGSGSEVGAGAPSGSAVSGRHLVAAVPAHLRQRCAAAPPGGSSWRPVGGLGRSQDPLAWGGRGGGLSCGRCGCGGQVPARFPSLPPPIRILQRLLASSSG